MPDSKLKHAHVQPQQLRSGLRNLEDDFRVLRQRGGPIAIHLTHVATNARAEGVKLPAPCLGPPLVAITGAGHRESRTNRDAKGQCRLIDSPVLDAAGKPILNSVGEALDVTCPASRKVAFAGDIKAVESLRGHAKRGGRLAVACRDKTLRLPAGWRFSTPEELWWALVFELAWSGRHPVLSAERQLWYTHANNICVFVPYDLQELRRRAESEWNPTGESMPKRWLERLPDAFMSTIPDAASACADLAGTLAEELANVERREENHPNDGLEYSEPQTLAYWARTFGVSRNTMGSYLRAGQVAGRKVGRTWSVAVWEIPRHKS